MVGESGEEGVWRIEGGMEITSVTKVKGIVSWGVWMFRRRVQVNGWTERRERAVERKLAEGR